MTCSVKGCTAAANAVPKLRIPAKGYSIARHTPMGLIVNLPHCREHQKAFDVAGMVRDSAELKASIETVAKARNHVAPDWDRVYVDWCHMASSEYQQFLRAQRNSRN